MPKYNSIVVTIKDTEFTKYKILLDFLKRYKMDVKIGMDPFYACDYIDTDNSATNTDMLYQMIKDNLIDNSIQQSVLDEIKVEYNMLCEMIKDHFNDNNDNNGDSEYIIERLDRLRTFESFLNIHVEEKFVHKKLKN
jgi:hypothetical protein